MATRRRPFSGKPISPPPAPLPPAPRPPINTVPGAFTVPVNTAKRFTLEAGDAPVVADSDSPIITTTVSCLHGHIIVAGASNVVVTGNSSPQVTITGSPAAINAQFNGMWYVAYLDYTGSDTITIRTTDGVAVDIDTVDVTVGGAAPPPPAPSDSPVNSVPGTQQITAPITSLTFSGSRAITVADADSTSLTTTLSVSNGIVRILVLSSGATILGNDTGSVRVSGTPAQINSALDGFQYIPTSGFTGTATLTVATTDGSTTDTDYVSIVVFASAPPPGPGTAPYYPFGSRLDLTNGKYPNGIVVNNRTQASMDTDLKNKYEQWKAARVYNVPSIPGAKAVKFTNADYPNTTNALTVSEGMGYGMILAVYFNDQTTFDGLLRLVRARPAYSIPLGYANAHLFLMDWKLGPNGESSGAYGGGWNAMDGDEDIAVALCLAWRQWGTTGTTYNYLTQAQNTIWALKAWNFHTNGTSKGLASSDISRTSDYMFGHFRAFAAATQDSWWTDTVIPRCIAINERCQTVFSAANSGPGCFVPDFVENTTGSLAGQAYTSPYVSNIASAFGVSSTYGTGVNAYVPCKGNRADWVSTEMHYFANAQRCPQRWGNDLIYSGDNSLKVQTNRLINYIKAATNGNPSGIAIGYRLNAGLQGSEGGPISMGTPYPARGMVAGFACGGQGDAAHQSWVNACYDWLINWWTTNYYDSELMLMALVALSGNWWTYPGAPQNTSINNNVPAAQSTTPNTPKNLRSSDGNAITVSYTGTKSVTTSMTAINGVLRMGALTAGASSGLFTQPAGSVSIASHGAIADGTTNNRAAIMAAITAAQGTASKTVWVPPGVWAFSGDVINANGVKIVGAGYMHSTLHALSYTTASVYLEGASPEIRQLKLTTAGTYTRQAPYEMTKVAIRPSATNWVVRDCWFEKSPAASCQTSQTTHDGLIAFNTFRNSLSDSIHMEGGAYNIIVEYNDVDNSGDDGIAVVNYWGATDRNHHITIRNNVVKNQAGGRNISCVGGDDILIYNNYIEGNDEWAGILVGKEDLVGAGTINSNRVRVELNTIRNCGNSTTGHTPIFAYSGAENPDGGSGTNDDIYILRNDIIVTGGWANIWGIKYGGPQTNFKLEQNRYTGSGELSFSYYPGTTPNPNTAYSSGPIGYTSTGSTSDTGTINGSGTKSVSVSGTLAQVNAALSDVQYAPDLNYTGTDTITINSTDGTVTDVDNLSITVAATAPPPPAPPAGSTGEDVLTSIFATGVEGTWLDPTPISRFETTDTSGVALTAYGNLFGRWKDRSGRNRDFVESDLNERPSARNDRLGYHASRYGGGVVAGIGGATTKMYLCMVLEAKASSYYGTWFSDENGNAGIRLYHNADESGQATWEGAPAPTGDIRFSVGNGTGRVEARRFSMGTGGTSAGNPPPYTVFTGARVLEAWVDGGNVNLRINKGAVHTVSLGGASIAAGNANMIYGARDAANTDWCESYDYQVIYMKNHCPTSAERDLIATWVGAKAGITI